MTRQIRYIIITVCIVAVLGVVLLLMKFLPGGSKSSSSSSGTSSSSTISLIKVDYKTIGTIHFNNSNGQYTVRKSGDTWTVDELNKAPINTDSMNNLVYDMASVSATQVVSENDSKKADYGLDTPKATVDITTTAGKSYTAYLGNTAPYDNGYYLMLKGNSKIYLIDTVYGTDMLSSPSSLVNLTLSTIDSSKLTSLTDITFGGTSRTEPIKLKIDSTSASTSSDSNGSIVPPTYNITSPGNYQTNTTTVSTLVNGLLSLSANDAVAFDVSEKSLSSYGLYNPAYTLSYTYDKKTYSYDFGNTFTKDGTEYIYVMEEGKSAVYDVEVSTVDFYNYQLYDLSPVLAFMPSSIDTVKTVTITDGSNTWKFNLSGTTTSLKVTSGSKTLDTAQFRNFYQQLSFSEPEGTATKASSSKLLLRITYDYRTSGKKSDVVEYYTVPEQNDASSVDSYRAAIVVNGNSEFYVKRSFVDTILQYTKNVMNGKAVPAPF